MIDLSNAFFSVPLEKDSQYWFAFTFEGQRYTFTRLPQGYAESPTIFSEAISNCLADFNPPEGSQILVYVDDILVVSKEKQACKTDSIALLEYLAKTGHKVNKNKLQLWQQEVKYLGHTLTHEGRRVNDDRKKSYSLCSPTSNKETDDVILRTV